MKNKRLRNSLIAAVVAISAGVVLFGVNAAIGDAPGYTPPGSGVSPIFTNIGVTGDATIGGSTAIFGNFLASGATNRFDGDLEVDGSLEVLETLEVSNFYGITTNDANPVKIDDDLTVIGGIDLTGDVLNSEIICGSNPMIPCVGQSVTIDDKLVVLRDIYTPQTGQFGYIDTPEIKYVAGSGGDPLTVNDDLDVNGVANFGSNVHVDGYLNMDGGGQIGSFYDIYKYNTAAAGNMSSMSSSCYSGDVLVACHGYTNQNLNLKSAYALGNSCYVNYNSAGLIGAILKCWDPAGVTTGRKDISLPIKFILKF